MKGCILPFPKKCDIGLAKNYRGITLTSIAAKIYNALLRNRIEPKIDNILRKTEMASEEIDPRPHKYWPSVESLKAYGQKNLLATILFVDFTEAFDSIHRGKMEQILLAYGTPKETEQMNTPIKLSIFGIDKGIHHLYDWMHWSIISIVIRVDMDVQK